MNKGHAIESDIWDIFRMRLQVSQERRRLQEEKERKEKEAEEAEAPVFLVLWEKYLRIRFRFKHIGEKEPQLTDCRSRSNSPATLAGGARGRPPSPGGGGWGLSGTDGLLSFRLPLSTWF